MKMDVSKSMKTDGIIMLLLQLHFFLINSSWYVLSPISLFSFPSRSRNYLIQFLPVTTIYLSFYSIVFYKDSDI